MAIMLTVVLTCVPFAPFERPKDIEQRPAALKLETWN